MSKLPPLSLKDARRLVDEFMMHYYTVRGMIQCEASLVQRCKIAGGGWRFGCPLEGLRVWHRQVDIFVAFLGRANRLRLEKNDCGLLDGAMVAVL